MPVEHIGVNARFQQSRLNGDIGRAACHQLVRIDLHRQRSVIVRQADAGELLSAVRIGNDPVALGLQIKQTGPDPEVVLEATYGWYWAADALAAAGASVHLAHPFGVKGFGCRRVKTTCAMPEI